jgi:hypothetical protein
MLVRGVAVVEGASTTHTCSVAERYEEESKTRPRHTVCLAWAVWAVWDLVEEKNNMCPSSWRCAATPDPVCCAHLPEHFQTWIRNGRPHVRTLALYIRRLLRQGGHISN